MMSVSLRKLVLDIVILEVLSLFHTEDHTIRYVCPPEALTGRPNG